MKIIKYKFLSAEVNRGTEEQPIIEQIFLNAEVLCPTQAVLDANLPRVQKEAYNGEYTIEDDGQPEPETMETTDDVLNALLGVTV